MSHPQTLIQAQVLRRICGQLLTRVGVPDDQAMIVAEAVVEADLRGIGSHGVLRLPAYVHRVQAGTMTADTVLLTAKDRGAALLLDAQHGFGQVAGVRAMEQALTRAEMYGSCFVGVRNAGHFGIGAYYAMMALPRKMVGIVSGNAAASMAPWGGTAPLLGTNPICVAIPTGGDVDIVLDMASSIAARGKIRLAAATGGRIPLGWALDDQGRPTEDPQAAMKGTLLPIGGPKGYGLALVVDVLGGVLTGSAFGAHIASVHDVALPVSTGFVVQALDVAAFAEMADFERSIQLLVAEIRGSPRAEGVDTIYLPGEIEWRMKQERLESGIPVAESLRRELDDLAVELGMRLAWNDAGAPG